VVEVGDGLPLPLLTGQQGVVDGGILGRAAGGNSATRCTCISVHKLCAAWRQGAANSGGPARAHQQFRGRWRRLQRQPTLVAARSESPSRVLPTAARYSRRASALPQLKTRCLPFADSPRLAWPTRPPGGEQTGLLLRECGCDQSPKATLCCCCPCRSAKRGVVSALKTLLAYEDV
jgi:hypothetical protein